MSPLHAAYRFESLVVGANNRTAATAARAVASAPGTSYNPLFLYSLPGLGKTHILVAVGNLVREVNPTAQVEYLTLDEFVEAFHAAVGAGQADAYRARFTTTDVLLIDDVQFLGQRREMQAELLRLLDHLQAAGKQVVLTSDRSPADIDLLDDRLLKRIAGGLVIDIGPPDYETQVAILRRKAEEKEVSFADGVLEAIARLGIPSVRELIGALNRLVAFQAVSEVPLDAYRARVLIGGEDEAAAIEVPQLEHAEVTVPAATRALEEMIPGVQLGQSDLIGGSAGESDFERADDAWMGIEAEATSEYTRYEDGAFEDDVHDAGPLLPGDDALDPVDGFEPATERHRPSGPADLTPLDDKPPVSAPRDEFGDFLSDLAETLARQVEPWRSRVGEAILRWEGEGFRVATLERLLQGDEPRDPESVLIQYEADAERLLELRREALDLAPEMADVAQLADPSNMVTAEAWMQRLRDASRPPSSPSDAWRLEALIEGTGNRMALRAALAAIGEPGTRYNPLVVVGGSGVGKTHLLHGVGNALMAQGASPVACVSAHEFTQELIDAIDRDSVPAWRNRYRRCAALLIDDVHLIAGKDRTQEELFLLFNLFLESNRQLAFGSAVPLSELSGVESRLLTRLEGGLVVELPPPDRELRQRMIERILGARGGADADLVNYLAARPAESARAVQGAVQRVLNAADAADGKVSLALAREVLEGAARRPAPPPAAGPRPVSGVAASGVRSREKMVWNWPGVNDRVIEEWR